MPQDRMQLEAFVRALSEERAPWERAGTVLLEATLRKRLACLGIEIGPDAGVVLMAVAVLLAEGTQEWGGDACDTLAELAALGLSLLDEEPRGR